MSRRYAALQLASPQTSTLPHGQPVPRSFPCAVTGAGSYASATGTGQQKGHVCRRAIRHDMYACQKS